MAGLEFVHSYIDNLLITTMSTWEDHLNCLDIVFQQLSQAGLKVIAQKSFFGHSKLEYLDYWITRDRIQPVAKKVEAIKNIAPPKTRKELRWFIGIVNYYRYMWIRQSDVLAPLSHLTSTVVPWRWTDIEQNAFNMMKHIISWEMLLVYTDFSQPFALHTDASHKQLGAIISQNESLSRFIHAS